MKIILTKEWEHKSKILKAGEKVDIHSPTAKQMIRNGLAIDAKTVLVKDRIELIALCDFKLRGKNYKEGEVFTLDIYFQKTANKLIKDSKANYYEN